MNYDPDCKDVHGAKKILRKMAVTEAGYIRLMEAIGWLLYGDMTIDHRFVTFIGRRGAGKSLLSKALTRMIGSHNVSTEPLERITERFGTFPTFGKLLNIMDETNDASMVERKPNHNRIKQFADGGNVSFEQKGQT